MRESSSVGSLCAPLVANRALRAGITDRRGTHSGLRWSCRAACGAAAGPVGRRDQRGPAARGGDPRQTPLCRHSLCGPAGGATALAASATGAALVGRARRHQGGAALHPGRGQRPGDGQADRRGLPDPQRLDSTAGERASAGDGLDPWRCVHQRQRRHVRLALVRRPGRYRRRHAQLPSRCARLSGASCAGAGRRRRQLRSGGPAGGAALGARQHHGVRRRPGQGDHRR